MQNTKLTTVLDVLDFRELAPLTFGVVPMPGVRGTSIFPLAPIAPEMPIQVSAVVVGVGGTFVGVEPQGAMAARGSAVKLVKHFFALFPGKERQRLSFVTLQVHNEMS